MTRRLSKFAHLSAVLDATDQPVAIIDRNGVISYCNRAMLDWVGGELDDLLGRQCRYHSGVPKRRERTPDDIAIGLCPPPEALRGRETRAMVSAVDAEGWLQRRMARFVPISVKPNGRGSKSSDSMLPNEKSSSDKLSGESEIAGLIMLVDSVAITDTTSSTTGYSIPDATAPNRDDSESLALHDQLQQFHTQLIARYTPEQFVGQSAAIARVRSQVRLAAMNRVHLTISGPRGSGRQHAARAIHYGYDAERAGALFPVDCAVLGADIIESTLRTLADREPRPHTPGRSTMLLTDVDRLSGELQALLLSIMRSHRFAIRVIATSAQPLAHAVRNARFRDDLAGMLTTIEIDLPPLIRRRGDIPLLAQAFLEELNSQGKKQIGGFASSALDLLDSYHWPGNLTELYATIATAHRRTASVRIEPDDLTDRLHYAADAEAHNHSEITGPIDLDEHLAQVEQDLIRRTLQQTRGNRAEAARRLGLTRATLYRRMERLGIEP